MSPPPCRHAGVRPQVQPPLLRAGTSGPRGTPTVRTPVVAPHPKLLVEAPYAPDSGQVLIASPLSQNLPNSFPTSVMTTSSQQDRVGSPPERDIGRGSVPDAGSRAVPGRSAIFTYKPSAPVDLQMDVTSRAAEINRTTSPHAVTRQGITDQQVDHDPPGTHLRSDQAQRVTPRIIQRAQCHQ